MPVPTPCPPARTVDCEPEVQTATSTAYILQNKKKQQNFIRAEITSMGSFKAYVENQPKDGTGCAGWWLFQIALNYFVQEQQVAVVGVRGDWTFGDNLATVNRLTAGNQITLEEASRQTWTYQQASQHGLLDITPSIRTAAQEITPKCRSFSCRERRSMDSLDPELVARLRAMARRGDQPSAMLHAIISQFSPATVDRLLLVSYFSTAFCFIDGQGHPLFGWFSDGSGELKDRDIDRILSRRGQQTRPAWDKLDSSARVP